MQSLFNELQEIKASSGVDIVNISGEYKTEKSFTLDSKYSSHSIIIIGRSQTTYSGGRTTTAAVMSGVIKNNTQGSATAFFTGSVSSGVPAGSIIIKKQNNVLKIKGDDTSAVTGTNLKAILFK